MNHIAIAFAVLLAGGAAAAQGRPSTVERSCIESRRLVEARGAIVLGTGRQTYDRFVRDRGFCQFDEFAKPAFVRSRDVQACFVGYTCDSNSPWE